MATVATITAIRPSIFVAEKMQEGNAAISSRTCSRSYHPGIDKISSLQQYISEIKLPIAGHNDEKFINRDIPWSAISSFYCEEAEHWPMHKHIERAANDGKRSQTSL